jgi:diamine N-acetyltransferase
MSNQEYRIMKACGTALVAPSRLDIPGSTFCRSLHPEPGKQAETGAFCGDNTNMNIRPAIQSDLAALVALNQPVQKFHAGLRPDLIRSPDTHDMTPWLAEFIAKENFRVLVAEELGHPVGHAVYEIRSRAESLITCARRSIYVHQMSVAPEKRRKGIGKALLRYIREQARELGITSIELDVWSANTQAKEFYQSLGFTSLREVLEWREG